MAQHFCFIVPVVSVMCVLLPHDGHCSMLGCFVVRKVALTRSLSVSGAGVEVISLSLVTSLLYTFNPAFANASLSRFLNSSSVYT